MSKAHSKKISDLWVDERRIRQVLINLLNNAVKFTPEAGKVTLEVTPLASQPAGEQPSYLRIAVHDTGIGIAPENFEKLFQPFVQIDSALNRQYSGTGLGLALVKRLVELHAGDVGVSSEVGVGTCFTIDLPCVPQHSIALGTEMQQQQSPLSPSLELIPSPLILLAEDNEANIHTLCSYLRAKGYRICLATNGEAALTTAKSANPDLILMDIQIPEIDGLEVIRRIRCDPDLEDIPIIALTALVMTGDRDRCIAAGANEYLSKPVKLKQLVTTIQQLLRTKQGHE